jgi:hypothetical protein
LKALHRLLGVYSNLGDNSLVPGLPGDRESVDNIFLALFGAMGSRSILAESCAVLDMEWETPLVFA